MFYRDTYIKPKQFAFRLGGGAAQWYNGEPAVIFKTSGDKSKQTTKISTLGGSGCIFANCELFWFYVCMSRGKYRAFSRIHQKNLNNSQL